MRINDNGIFKGYSVLIALTQSEFNAGSDEPTYDCESTVRQRHLHSVVRRWYVFRELHSGRNELATLTHIDIAFVRSRYERKGLLENVFPWECLARCSIEKRTDDKRGEKIYKVRSGLKQTGEGRFWKRARQNAESRKTVSTRKETSGVHFNVG